MAKKRSPKNPASHSSTAPGAQRLNKVLAAAGLGSRRKVEQLIEQGRVEIDSHVVSDLACKVDPTTVKIKVDGQLLKRARPVYFALNKPPGVLSTNYDPSGRMRVIDLVPDRDRVFSVGRLDQSSEGLMLLTNDGELAQRLAHPKFRIQKAYFVVVSGQMTEEELNKLRKGVYLAEGMARIDGATIKRVRKGCTELEIVLSEGKNREIRRILARADHKVVLLRRIAIGPLRLGQLPVGASRTLTAAEVKALYSATDSAARPKKKPSTPSSKIASSRSANSKNVGQTLSPKTKQPTALADEDDDDDLLSLAAAGQINDGDDDFSDDDFVGDFSGAGGQGSVLPFDDESPAPPSRGVGRGRKSTEIRKSTMRASAGQTGSSRSSLHETGANPYAKAAAKARAASSTGSTRRPRGTQSTATARSAAQEIGNRAQTGAGKRARPGSGKGKGVRKGPSSSNQRAASPNSNGRSPKKRGKR